MPMCKKNYVEEIVRLINDVNPAWIEFCTEPDEFKSQVYNLREEAQEYICEHFEEEFAPIIGGNGMWSAFFTPLGNKGLLKVEPAIVGEGVLRLRYNRYLMHGCAGTFELHDYADDHGVSCEDVRVLERFESLGTTKHRRLVDLYRFCSAARAASLCKEYRDLVLQRSPLLSVFLCNENDLYSFVNVGVVAAPEKSFALALKKSGHVFAECDVSATSAGIRSGCLNLVVDLGFTEEELRELYEREYAKKITLHEGKLNRGALRRSRVLAKCDAHSDWCNFMYDVIGALAMLVGVGEGTSGFRGGKHVHLPELVTQKPICSCMYDVLKLLKDI